MFDLHCFEWRWDSFEVCMECMCWLQWDFRPPAEYCSSAFSANERSKRRVDGRDAVKSLELCLRSEHWLCSVRTWISKVFLVVLWEEFQIISFSMWLRCQVSKPCTKWATGYVPIRLLELPSVFPDAKKGNICSGNWNGTWRWKRAAEVCLGKGNVNFIQAELMYTSTSGLHLKERKQRSCLHCKLSDHEEIM